MSTSMYQFTAKTVDPLSNMLKAVAELNAYAAQAKAAGWAVKFTLPFEGDDAVGVSITRDSFPTDDENGEPPK